MESFEKTFEVTFNPRAGFVSHKEGKVSIKIVLDDVWSVHTAKKILSDMGIHASSISRIDD